MAVGDKADLLNTVSTILPDNNTGEIDPSDLRTTESARHSQAQTSALTLNGLVLYEFC